MLQDIAERMREKSDEELYGMLYAHSEDWTAEALEAAKQEFQKRRLSPARLGEIQTNAEMTKREEEELANEPLSFLLKVLFFVFNPISCLGLFILVPIAEVAFNNRGYKKKYREAWKCMGYGMCVMLGMFVLPLLSKLLIMFLR